MGATRVLVIGATGFTGRFVVRKLAEAGHTITAFVRENSPRETIKSEVSRFAEGDLRNYPTVRAACADQDVIVNVASLLCGDAAALAQAIRETGVERSVFFSTTSLFTTLPAATKLRRQQCEGAVATVNNWTIFRPTMIYGTPADRNLIRLIRWVDRWPVVPVFGPGTYIQQPVHVDDLADAVVRALDNPCTFFKAYNLSGAGEITYNDLVKLVAERLGRKPMLVHLPIVVSLAIVGLLRRLPMRLTFSREQVLRLNEHKNFAYSDAARDFGYCPRPICDGISAEIRLYRDGQVRGKPLQC